MTTVSVEPFLPRCAAPGDLADWCAVFSDGHGELSGSSVQPSLLAKRLLAEDSSAMRWAGRGLAGTGVGGVAELRPQPHVPGAGFLRLFVAPTARRGGIGSVLLSRVMQCAATTGMDQVQATVPAGPPGEPFARALPICGYCCTWNFRNSGWIRSRCGATARSWRRIRIRAIGWRIGPLPNRWSTPLGR
ncbi:GNAT family N-acetyltransferase [Streptomyces anulatus]|uniref:GNAT family N-acetyltransferase n=2 Tax=Streptomyces anulatus TaxID=1892 RepID=UPI00386859FF